MPVVCINCLVFGFKYLGITINDKQEGSGNYGLRTRRETGILQTLEVSEKWKHQQEYKYKYRQ